MSFWKNALVRVKNIEFFGTSKIDTLGQALRGHIGFQGQPNLDETGIAVAMQTGVGLRGGKGKVQHIQEFTGASATITNGLAATSNSNVLALTTLTAAAQVITAGITNPDCPRTLSIVCAKTGATGVGNGIYPGDATASANSRQITITGTNIHDKVIYEDVALNDTSAVVTTRAFKTVTSITLPIKANTNTGDQVSVGAGNVFGIAHPIELSADVIECEGKISAAVAYTIESLGTLDVGYAATTIANTSSLSTGGTGLLKAGLSITLASATGWPAVANTAGRIHGRIYSADGTYEDIIVILRATTTLTVIRGACGTTARDWPKGSDILWLAGNTYARAITVNDRFRLLYQSKLL